LGVGFWLHFTHVITDPAKIRQKNLIYSGP
jgi:hypothetical protein